MKVVFNYGEVLSTTLHQPSEAKMTGTIRLLLFTIHKNQGRIVFLRRRPEFDSRKRKSGYIAKDLPGVLELSLVCDINYAKLCADDDKDPIRDRLVREAAGLFGQSVAERLSKHGFKRGKIPHGALHLRYAMRVEHRELSQVSRMCGLVPITAKTVGDLVPVEENGQGTLIAPASVSTMYPTIKGDLEFVKRVLSRRSALVG